MIKGSALQALPFNSPQSVEKITVTQTQLKILTINIWGAPYAIHRVDRFRALVDGIATLNPDFVLIQEAFIERERTPLINGLTDKTHLKHWRYFPSGWLGSGLLTLSRFEIFDSHFHRFRMGGKPERIMQGDYYGGKGIGMIRVMIDDEFVDVYNVHPHAQYERDHDNEYAVYTDSNLFEATRFINTHSATHPAIVGGDFNTRPDQSGYRLLTALANLQDVYTTLHGDYPVTFSPANPYTKSQAQCLDYIFLRDGKSQVFTAQSAEITLTARLYNYDAAQAYSDHYGVLATVTLQQGESVHNVQESARITALSDLKHRLQTGINETQITQSTYSDRAMIGAAAFIDLLLFSSILNRIFRQYAGRIRFKLGLVALIFTLYQAAQAWVSLPARKQTLQALTDEVDLLISRVSKVSDAD